MFAALLACDGGKPFDHARIAASLGAHGADVQRREGMLAAGWAKCDNRTAFLGWIDNASAIASEIGLEPASVAATYGAAADRWGEAADARLIGNYAAASLTEAGTLRLARSPWSAPPLYWAHTPSGWVASPLLRVLFAAGVEKRLDYQQLVNELGYGERTASTDSPYCCVFKVPLGTVVELAPGREPLVRRWYDPLAVPSQAHLGEPERVEQARALLGEAVSHAERGVGRKAMALSGGLDSALATEALLRCGEGPLPAITFAPHPDAPLPQDRGVVADERPVVERFAAMHPRIVLHRASPEPAEFDHRAREMFQAMQIYAPGMANVGMHHGLYARARELDCGWLLTATLGNQSFSADGRWAYAEYARRWKWGELVALLRNRPGDDRSLPRKLLALGILPNLPRAIRARARALVHPARRDMVSLLTLLRPEARASLQASAWDDLHFGTSREAAVRADYFAEDGLGADVTLAFEQVYGVRHRDVTAYRPLLEFCAGLPTEAFASGGVERRLAKEMARGIMPEEQRANRRQARHSADMMWRIGHRREELLALCRRMREHDWLGRTIDIDRLEHLLIDWPETPGIDIERDWPRILAIPRAVLAAQFVAFSEGRNRL